MIKNKVLVGLLAALGSFGAVQSQAITVWTDWETVLVGASGAATGALDSVQVQYSGQVLGNTNINGSTVVWNPETSYIGGSIDTSPDDIGDIITLSSGSGSFNFSSTVINPVIAFWSLGQPSFLASFVFDQTPTFQTGGPNSIYGGSAIQVSGNTVSGFEGNGIVMFEGSFDSLSWSSSYENYYGITVGANGFGNSVNPVPLPGSIWLFGAIMLGWLGWRKPKSSNVF